MRLLMHPATLAVVLTGLLLWSWSILTPVSIDQWLLYAAIGAAVIAAASRDRP